MQILQEYQDLQKIFLDSFLEFSGKKIGVAVSGGGDSLAMLLVAASSIDRINCQIEVATVDHGLRADSGAEAQFVKDICDSIYLKHSILPWEKPDKINNIQNCARLARLRLLTEWANRDEISIILLGHSADDQAETIIMNLIRGSGIEGLRGMPSFFLNEGIIFARPFLSVGRERLRSFLQDHEYSWIEDPSNSDEKFQRVRVRKILPKLSELGLTIKKINLTGERMACASSLLRQLAGSEIEKCISINSWGELKLHKKHFLFLPMEIQMRILTAVVGGLRGTQYRPRYKLIKSLLGKMSKDKNQLGVTTCGLKVTENTNDFLFQREISGIPEIAKITSFTGSNLVGKTLRKAKNRFVWDNRWVISIKLDQSYYTAKIGRITNKAILKCLRKGNSNVKYYTAASLPAIFLEGKVIALAGLMANKHISFSVLYTKQTFAKRLENGQ